MNKFYVFYEGANFCMGIVLRVGKGFWGFLYSWGLYFCIFMRIFFGSGIFGSLMEIFDFWYFLGWDFGKFGGDKKGIGFVICNYIISNFIKIVKMGYSFLYKLG